MKQNSVMEKHTDSRARLFGFESQVFESFLTLDRLFNNSLLHLSYLSNGKDNSHTYLRDIKRINIKLTFSSYRSLAVSIILIIIEEVKSQKTRNLDPDLLQTKYSTLSKVVCLWGFKFFFCEMSTFKDTFNSKIQEIYTM